MIQSNRHLVDHLLSAIATDDIAESQKIGIFCTNVFLWHLSLRIRPSDAGQLEKREQWNTQRRKKRGTMFRFNNPLFQAEAGAHCWYLLWEKYLDVIMPGHGNATALFLSECLYISRRSEHQHRSIPTSSVWFKLRSHGKFSPYARRTQENTRKY